MYSFPDLEPVCCLMSHSNCCCLTCMQIFLRLYMFINAKTDFNQQEKGLPSKNSCAYVHQPINQCIKHDALNAVILILQNPTWTLFYFLSRTLNGDINIFLFRALFAFCMVTFSLQPNIYSKIATDICISHSSKASILHKPSPGDPPAHPALGQQVR